jgi:hypothetical protein
MEEKLHNEDIYNEELRGIAPSGEDGEVKSGKKELVMIAKFNDELCKNLNSLLKSKFILSRSLTRSIAALIFRECMDTMVMHVSDLEDKKLSVWGVGRFYIYENKSHGLPHRPSKLAMFETTPKIRWKPSKRYFKYVIEKLRNFKF